jgi:predicted DNA-binding transcriptional regulator AlpA
MIHEEVPHDVLLPISAVCKIVARSKASIYRDIKRKTFPAAQMQGRSSRWRRSLVMQVVNGSYSAPDVD